MKMNKFEKIIKVEFGNCYFLNAIRRLLELYQKSVMFIPDNEGENMNLDRIKAEIGIPISETISKLKTLLDPYDEESEGIKCVLELDNSENIKPMPIYIKDIKFDDNKKYFMADKNIRIGTLYSERKLKIEFFSVIGQKKSNPIYKLFNVHHRFEKNPLDKSLSKRELIILSYNVFIDQKKYFKNLFVEIRDYIDNLYNIIKNHKDNDIVSIISKDNLYEMTIDGEDNTFVSIIRSYSEEVFGDKYIYKIFLTNFSDEKVIIHFDNGGDYTKKILKIIDMFKVDMEKVFKKILSAY